jgi:hypothetical protein
MPLPEVARCLHPSRAISIRRSSITTSCLPLLTLPQFLAMELLCQLRPLSCRVPGDSLRVTIPPHINPPATTDAPLSLCYHHHAQIPSCTLLHRFRITISLYIRFIPLQPRTSLLTHHSNIAFCFHSIPSYTLRLLVAYPLIYASHATRNPLLRSTAPHTDILS